MSPRAALVAGGVAAAFAVGAGAFGAHALAATVTPDRLETWRTGASYAQTHAIALVVLGALGAARPDLDLGLVSALLLAGLVLFSGSLFALVLTDTAWLGAITPLGGLSWIGAWLLLAWRVFRSAAV